MKTMKRCAALLLCLSVLVLGAAVSASAEEAVAFDFFGKLTMDSYSESESSSRFTLLDEGGFSVRPKTSLSSGGSAIVYLPSTTYQSDWLFAYDVEFESNGDPEDSLYLVLCTWGENRFLNDTRDIPLSELLPKIAGVDPVMKTDDKGNPQAQIPAGHYQGIIDLSEYIPEGFDQFSHLGAWYTGKRLTVRRLEFVTGAEVTPPATTTQATTTTTTEATTTTTESKTEAAATTTANGTSAATATEAANGEPSSLSAGAIVGIAAAVVVPVGICVAVCFLVRRKKKQ